MTSSPTEHVSFGTHLNELRTRLAWCLIFWGIGSGLGYTWHEQILSFLVTPLGQTLYYFSPSGAFGLTLSVSFFFGIILTLPIFIYHIIRFVEPIAEVSLGKVIFPIIFFSIVLATGGILFAYLICLPAALHFLAKFNSQQIQSLISTQEYFSFITTYLVGFAIIFQIPLLVTVLNRLIHISAHKLLKYQPAVIIGSFVLAAIITPTPDPINQTLMAAPTLLLYYTSVGIVALQNRHRI